MAKPIQTITMDNSSLDSDPAKVAACGLELSRQNPDRVVTCYAGWSNTRFYIYQNLSSVPIDTPDTRQMLTCTGGFWRNGKKVSPTPGWLRRQSITDSRGHR